MEKKRGSKKNDNDKNNKNPLDELTKQVQDMLGKVGGGNIQISSFLGPEHDDEIEDDDDEKSHEDALKRIQKFNYKPREIKEYLDRFVISQDEAKKVLSVAICDHYNHVRKIINSYNKNKEYVKQNVLILGPTGVGKTYLVKTIAKLIGVPFVKADATKFTETGYVGGDVEDLVRNLVKAANGDVELAQYGIVFIDEIDKITNAGRENSRDVSGRGVQVNLLKLMEETDVNVMSQVDVLNQMRNFISFGSEKKSQSDTINTRNILFIVSGAFDKISDIIKKRVGQGQIGFSADIKDDAVDYDILKQVSTEDFVSYGFEPEFIGRLPVRVPCKSLDENDLQEILTSSEGSILTQYEEDFDGYGIDLTFDDDAIKEISKVASKEKTGARGLLTVLEGIFRDIKFELPSTNAEKLTITKECVSDSKTFLENFLKSVEFTNDKDEEFNRFVESFEVNYGIKMTINAAAKKEIERIAEKENKSVLSICGRIFKDYGYALRLIAEKINYKITITLEAIKSPDSFLSKYVDKFFEHER
jgi:endopeptidase Clp ATP-binding regulatory subunit ClpX